MGRAGGGGRRGRGAVSAELPEDARRAAARATFAEEEGIGRPPRRLRREQRLDSRIVRPGQRPHFAPCALLRLLVRAEADQSRPVAEAVALELVEADLDDEFRAHRGLLESRAAPAVRLREALLRRVD